MEASEYRFSDMRILIVDHNDMARIQVEFLLRTLGVKHMEKARSGKEALEKIRKAEAEKRPYNLVTIELEIPEISGRDLLMLIRSDPKLCETPVLMISSLDDPNEIKDLATYHPDGYLLKPYKDGLFVQRVRAMYPKMLAVKGTP